ncbi:helix-turn-helix domain-containing protein [Oceanobacillus kimchii]|uniref:helix-turn-helix domain-containing protein n=1 Tax=Oceanobacillus kimchii TaxID=746691 RepID=UPI003B011C04
MEQRQVKIKLNELLKEKNLKQAELATAIDVRKATIHDLYHSKSKQIPVSVLNKIVNYFELDDISELIEVTEINNK